MESKPAKALGRPAKTDVHESACGASPLLSYNFSAEDSGFMLVCMVWKEFDYAIIVPRSLLNKMKKLHCFRDNLRDPEEPIWGVTHEGYILDDIMVFAVKDYRMPDIESKRLTDEELDKFELNELKGKFVKGCVKGKFVVITHM